MKICPLTAQLFRAYGRTEMHDESNSNFPQFYRLRLQILRSAHIVAFMICKWITEQRVIISSHNTTSVVLRRRGVFTVRFELCAYCIHRRGKTLETLLNVYQTIRCHILDDGIFHCQQPSNLGCHALLHLFVD